PRSPHTGPSRTAEWRPGGAAPRPRRAPSPWAGCPSGRCRRGSASCRRTRCCRGWPPCTPCAPAPARPGPRGLASTRPKPPPEKGPPRQESAVTTGSSVLCSTRDRLFSLRFGWVTAMTHYPVLLFVLAILLPAPARAEALTRHHFTEPHMGTLFHITLY